MDLHGKRFAYTIIETSRAADGGYIPVIAVEGESGYYPMSGQGKCATPWNWGKDIKLAEQCAADMNAEMGLSEADAWKIVASSMFPKAKAKK